MQRQTVTKTVGTREGQESFGQFNYIQKETVKGEAQKKLLCYKDT